MESSRRRLLLRNTARGISSLSISACVAVTFALPPVGFVHVDVVIVELDREVVVDIVVAAAVIAGEWPLRRLRTLSVVILCTEVQAGRDFAATCCSDAMILAAKSASVISSDLLCDVIGILKCDLKCFNCRVRGVKFE